MVPDVSSNKASESKTHDRRLHLKELQLSIDRVCERIYALIEQHIRIILVISLILSIVLSIFKTIFYKGYNVDSYQYYALSIERWLTKGVFDDLIETYYARHRILFPIIIALVHIVIPIDISLISCILNLLFSILSVFVLRDLLKLLDYSTFEIDLASLLVILSYNFINYWFNIQTDMIGLFFFLLMFRFVQTYLNTGQHLNLLYGVVALLLSILCREIYILGSIIFIWTIDTRQRRIIVSCILVIFIGLLLFLFDPSSILIKRFIPPDYHWAYEQGDYIQLFILMEQRWLNVSYTTNFIKGLVKVGILPTLGILVLIQVRKREFGLNISIKKIQKMNNLTVWLFFFLITYTLFNANLDTPTGLRYWIPISWIPLLFVSKSINRDIKSNTLKTLFVLFLAIYPIAWWSTEWYINRDVSTGTGPLTHPNYYFNGMNNLESVRSYDSDRISISIINGTYLSTTIREASSTPDSSNESWSTFGFPIWINISEFAVIRIRLASSNNAFFRIKLFEGNEDFSPGWADSRYSPWAIQLDSEFKTYEFIVNDAFLARFISLQIGLNPGSQVVWDFIEIFGN